MAEKLKSDTQIARLESPTKGQALYWDADLPGFGVRVTAAGARTFVLNYRVRGTGKERRYSIGSCSTWKLATARKEAERLRRVVDLGGDPMGDLEEQRKQAEQEKLRTRTVAQLCDEFERVHLPSLRPATRKFYRLAMKNHIKPAIGKTKVEDVARSDIEKIFDALTKKDQRHQANQSAVLAGVLFRYAAKWGWRTGDNPAAGIDKHTLEGKERYLSPAETKKLSAALDALEDAQAGMIFKVLLLTGSRVGETLRMRWGQIDFHRGIWSKPASTTKQKKTHHLPLTAPVLSIMRGIWESQSETERRSGWVFPGKAKEGHRNELRAAWSEAKEAAGITGLRIHDLRHSFASTLAGSGFSLPMIGAALGHSRVETTQRYAHLADDPLRMAMTRAADLIEAAGKGGDADVVKMADRRA